jgi:soluble lytic murein transglycosylase
MVLLSLLAATLPLAAAAPVADLGRGVQAFRAGDYRKAAGLLAPLPARLPRSRDHVLYLAAESEFYAGRPERARPLFEQLAAERDSRFAPLAPWRVADCLWSEGRQADAGAAYRKLLASPPAGVDAVVARFRLAELAPPDEAPALFHKIHVEHPAHPLAAEAGLRSGPAEAEPAAAPPAAEPAAPRPPLEPKARLRRAAVLAESKQYPEAIAELEALPPDLPPERQIERDFQLGMAKFSTRHDYAEAAELLLGVAPRLKGDRAPYAAFQGARALARIDRMEEAIAASLRVVERYPGSRWAAEAQFVAGWLEFNRGRYADCLAPLRTTLDRYGRSGFAAGASWYLALAHHFLGHRDEALAALENYARLTGADADAARRASYWRARFLAAKGNMSAAKAQWRDLVRREPLSYYGMLARARLRAAGVVVGVELPKPPPAPPVPPRKVASDPALLRADELDRAGLTVEAGVDLQRSEDELESRLGRDQALTVLLGRYPRYQAYRRAYQLASVRGATALESKPVGSARAVWEAVFPRAYLADVERSARAANAPSLFVYSIMQKESGFGPQVVSPADARGLLQLLPGRGAELAAKLAGKRKAPFFAEELFRPEVNIRLGAVLLGSLLKKFRGQAFLAAAAYNGGVAPMTRWLDKHGKRPLDEFVELVGFKESREYIKRVSAIYAKYSYLYTGKPYELPLKINRAYLKEKIFSGPAPEQVTDPD